MIAWEEFFGLIALVALALLAASAIFSIEDKRK
jgi:hypothetical protein